MESLSKRIEGLSNYLGKTVGDDALLATFYDTLNEAQEAVLGHELKYAVLGQDMKTRIWLNEGESYWALDPVALIPVWSVVDPESFNSNWVPFETEEICLAYKNKIWGK